MNQTGSGIGAGFLYAGKDMGNRKSPDFTGKSGFGRNCCRIMIFFNIQKQETDLSNGD